MFSLKEFTDFLKANVALLLLTLAVAASPAVIDVVTDIGPSFPSNTVARILLTAIPITLFSMAVFLFLWRSNSNKQTRMKYFAWCLLAFLVTFFAYMAMWAFYTFQDGAGVTRSAGFQRIELMPQDANRPLTSLLEDAGYKPELIWTDRSIRAVEFVRFCLWIAFFGALWLCFGVFIVNEGYSQKIAPSKER